MLMSGLGLTKTCRPDSVRSQLGPMYYPQALGSTPASIGSSMAPLARHRPNMAKVASPPLVCPVMADANPVSISSLLCRPVADEFQPLLSILPTPPRSIFCRPTSSNYVHRYASCLDLIS